MEAKDFDPERHGTDTGEVNTGIFCLAVGSVEQVLFSLTSANRAGEYYITDLVGHGVEAGLKVHALKREAALDLLGINSPLELSQAEERLRAATAQRLLQAGVLLHQPDGVVVGPKATVEPGAELTGPCRILGASRIARGAKVGAFCQITDSELEPGSEVREFCHLEGARLAAGAIAGPFARLRPGADLGEDSRVGNFVEMKKAVLGRGAKASHLTYLGDATVGAGANIGAGTITCNYDGVNKHKTEIGAGRVHRQQHGPRGPGEGGRGRAHRRGLGHHQARARQDPGRCARPAGEHRGPGQEALISPTGRATFRTWNLSKGWRRVSGNS